MTQGIAFFDFDDTLARGDSILPFLLYCIRKRIAPRRQLVKAAGAFLYWKVAAGRRPAAVAGVAGKIRHAVVFEGAFGGRNARCRPRVLPR